MGIYEFKADDAFRFSQEIGGKSRQKGDELQFEQCPYCFGGKNRKDRGTFSINLQT